MKLFFILYFLIYMLTSEVSGADSYAAAGGIGGSADSPDYTAIGGGDAAIPLPTDIAAPTDCMSRYKAVKRRKVVARRRIAAAKRFQRRQLRRKLQEF
ncbi:unnamed protein product, partial [Mesorhabditis belari]|uniref:Uncharacterized protein n=1 Tax=Mesorhabditis belari TaxID=2138241 RepID=A0AAF3EWB4_9BILA